nr:glycoside hydrolase family 20 zincin-like fold domain-containing protein [Candidatus Hydrogenedentota bacterium]
MVSVVLVLLLAGAQLQLTPVPQEVVFDGKNVFRLSPADPIVMSDAQTAQRDTAVALIRSATGFELPLVTADLQPRGARGIYLGEPGAREPQATRKPGSIMSIPSREPSTPPQGYSLRVTKDWIAVTGADPAGTFHGVQTLCQLINERGEIPCVTINDAPELAWRGAWVREALSTDQLDAFAALKCNLIAFESDDFLSGSPERLARWVDTFAEARRRHIEPVPVIRTLKNIAPLLQRHPQAAIARTVTEKVRLEEDNWALLSHPNVLETPETPITVSQGAVTYRPVRDFAIDRGDFAFPYKPASAPWLIRRNIGGAIPDGRIVTVTYTYVAPDTRDGLPLSEAAERAWLDMLEPVMRDLRPRFILANHNWPGEIARDPRAAAFSGNAGAMLADSVRNLDQLIRRMAPDAQLLVVSDGFQGTAETMRAVAAALPRSAACVIQAPETPTALAPLLGPWLGAGLDVFGMPQPGVQGAYAWSGLLSGKERRVRGLLVPLEAETVPTAAFKVAMQSSWSTGTPHSPWPETLNAYFNADLWEPDYAEVLSAVADHIDRNTLAGVTPEETHRAYLAFSKNMGAQLPASDPQVKLVSSLMASMTEYLALERDFTRDQQGGSIRKLVPLIERQTALDPRADEERAQRILGTVRGKGLFVPSSILFGVYLLPYREMKLLAGHRPLEIVAQPEYTDTEHTAQATYDFLAEPGPICRVDFDTVGAAAVTLDRSRDGKSFEPVQQWTSRERGGFRAPAILDTPVHTRYLRVTVDAPAEQAVLRNPRVFALKGPVVGVCGRSDVAPVLDGAFKEKCW